MAILTTIRNSVDSDGSLGSMLGLGLAIREPLGAQSYSYVHPKYAIRKMDYALSEPVYCPLLNGGSGGFATELRWRLDGDFHMIAESVTIK